MAKYNVFRKGVVIAIIVCFVGAGFVPNMYGSVTFNDILDQQQTEYNNGCCRYPGGIFAQSFKPTLNTLTRVELLMTNFHQNEHDFTISIRESLDGNDLTSVTIPALSIPEEFPGSWIEFDFPDISTTPEKTYYIIYHPVEDPSTCAIYWSFITEDLYDRGEFIRGCREGDCCFKTYGYNDGGSQPPEEEWNKTFGGTQQDYGASVQQTFDGGYIITGSTYSFGNGNSDVWLIKTDSTGNEEWNKTYGGPGYDKGVSLQQTFDGGYIIAGSTSSFGAGKGDIWLIRTDANGNEEWNKTYGGSNEEYSSSIRQTNDGGCVVVGTIMKSFWWGTPTDAIIIKTDVDGNIDWSKTFDDATYEGFTSVQQTADGGYIATGNIYKYGSTWNDVRLIKIDTNGNMEWSKTFGTSGGERGNAVQQTTDGGYIVAGQYNGYYIWLIKTDSNGNEEWNKVLGWGKANSIQQTSDDGYIIAGCDDFTTDILVVKTDSTGNEEWNKTYGGSYSENAYSVQQTMDGGYIVTGGTYSFGAGNRDAWLIKIAPEDVGNQPPNPPTNPIPADGATNVDLNPTLSVYVSDPDSDPLDVTFYDVSDGSIIGTDYNVPSGGTATTIWSDLFYYTGYFWCAIASDGIESTQSPSWMFTTVQNQPPTASFDINPTIGDTDTVFEFDASSSSDHEDDINDLQVKWDWEGDGIWDSDWSYAKQTSHQYSFQDYPVKMFNVKLAVKDREETEDVAEKELSVYFSDGDTIPEWKEQELAEKYFPIFFFDSDERCYPTSIQFHLMNSNLCYHTDILFDNEVMEYCPLDISDIHICNDENYYMDNIRGVIEDNSDIISFYESVRKIYGDTVYVHINKSEYNNVIYTAIQYWLFYGFNDGFWNNHEGDWEMVQVLLDQNDELAYVTCSWHDSSETRSVNEINVSDNHTIIYVALGSHANYFTTKDFWMWGEPLEKKKMYLISGDQADGKGIKLEKDNFSIILLGERNCHLDSHNWLDYYRCWGDWSLAPKILERHGPPGPMFRYERESWDFPAQWALKDMEITMSNCPVNLSIIDNETRTIGFADSVFVNEIPGASADIFGESEIYYLPSDLNYTYEVHAFNNGIYNLTVIRGKNVPIIRVTEIPILNTSIHQYYINWTALSQGAEGVTLQIDTDGDGIFERTITSDDELTQDEYILQTETDIDIDPDTLNLNSTGKWITCYIELPDGYEVEYINISTIILNVTVPVEYYPVNISDYDEDGIPDLMVKFDRQNIIDILEPGDNVEIKITGQLIDGIKFEGIDYIKVI